MAIDFVWNVDGLGSWSDANAWDPVGVPGVSDNVEIRNQVTPSNPVTVEATGVTRANALEIIANGLSPHTLSIENGSSLRMGGLITNDGRIVLNSSGSLSFIRAEGADLQLDGSGVIELGDAGPNRMDANGNFQIINGASHRIEGAGSLGNNTAAFSNLGTIDANVSGGVLTLDPRNNGGGVTTFVNDGTAQASNGGTLLLSGNGFGEFGGSGLYQALTGSEVVFDTSAIVRTPNFNTAGTGLVRTAGGSNTEFFDMTNSGAFAVGNNADARMHGTVTNSGEITLASTGNQSDFELGSHVTLTGGGTLTMSGADAQVNSVGDFTLTNVNNTIQGAGNLGDNTAAIVNQSLIDANVSGGTITIDPRNRGWRCCHVSELRNGASSQWRLSHAERKRLW